MNVPILLYHSISDEIVPSAFERWMVTSERFEAHMSYLFLGGFMPLTVSHYLELRNLKLIEWLGKKPILITFDDGFEDFYTVALPILNRYQFVATIYVVTQYLNQSSQWLKAEGVGSKPMMLSRQVAALKDYGIEVGAHTETHPQLDIMPVACARDEIKKSKLFLEEIVESEIKSFAYPHGYHTAALKGVVRDLGFESACAVKHALSPLNDDPYALSRIIVSRETSVSELASLIEGRGIRVGQNEERLRTKLWRIKRRLSHTFMSKILSTKTDIGKA